MKVRVLRIVSAVVALTVPATLFASWIQFDLPTLSSAWGPTALAHLPDGRYVFAENGSFYLQDAWNSASYSAYSGEPSTDPSFIGIYDGTHAVAGRGTWAASDMDVFDPSSLSSPGFSSVGVSLQNYHGVIRDASSVYVGGSDTGVGGNHHGIRYVTLDGSVNKVVIDDISVYSCGFAIDAGGNLYVGDNDDGCVYRFTAAQLGGAIAGSALSIGDGEFIYDFGGGGNLGTLAVDGHGRVWATGWQQVGLKVYNPSLAQEFTYVPGLANTDYKVAAFYREGVPYIAYLNQANAGQNGSAQYYGFDEAAAYAIPEPGTLALLGTGVLLTVIHVRRRQTA